ncbi:MFS transporter [Gryllotalpicola ginsengisoli]|uniref:MFS transporter n=1 Tax=Gryllotalpicola ginsengisoli TaxID=444608 RepID=UPI0003B5C604|nr:MFS transporter [Gryllotalpicola ginsengisoli]
MTPADTSPRTTRSDAPARTPSRRPWLLACAALFAVAWGGNEFTPLLVMYRQRDHLGAVTVDALLGVYVLGIVPAMLVAAPLSDRYGRRPLMVPAPFLAALGSLVLAFAYGSPVLLGVGRVLCGIALGLAMAVGTAWVKELSQHPFEDAPAATGATRGALSLTAGFLLGAVAAAALAQYAPLPQQLPYLVCAGLSLAAGLLGARAPETRARGARASLAQLASDLKVPAASHRRFMLVVLPASSWVFGTAGSSYAVLPAVLAGRVPGEQIAFSGLLCLVTLGAAFLVQPTARRLHSPRSALGMVVAMAAAVAGMLTCALATATLSPAVAIGAAAVLGVGNGLLMLGGMLEVQRIARPDDLAGLTALYYSAAYAGFFIPAILAALSPWVPYPVLFLAGAVIGGGCIAVIAAAGGRHLHRHGERPQTRPLDAAAAK